MPLIPIEDLRQRPPLTGWAPFALGFRPFFLAAGVYAVLLLAVWLAVLQGLIELGSLSPLVWHGHEMLFGFGVAVIAGFLLTATQNWTGIRTPHGAPLAMLFALWLAGRLAFLTPGLAPAWTALVDASFLPVLAYTLARPILRARQLHNYPFPVMLLALAAANGLVHVEALGWADTARAGLHLAAFVVVTMIVVISGRIIPNFTDNKLHTRARRWRFIERSAPFATLAALLAALLAPVSPFTAWIAAIASVIHLIRLAGWYTPKYWAVPLLWVLHLGYAWVGVGFALLALSAAGMDAAAGSALHAFTAGSIGVLTLGMMARVSLGHSGRPLEVAPLMTWAFVAINVSAVFRVAVPLLAPQAYTESMIVAGLLWIAAFALFVAIYTPILLRPRADGKEG